MKNTLRYTLALLTAGTILPVGALLAQSPAPAATPSVSVPADTASTTADTTTPTRGRHHGKRGKRAGNLTPEEHQQLKAARRKAKEDPAVKAAEATRTTDRKGYHKAMKDAMLRADPSIAPILEKQRESRPGKKNA